MVHIGDIYHLKHINKNSAVPLRYKRLYKKKIIDNCIVLEICWHLFNIYIIAIKTL